jgi:hypothetical protein
MCVILRNSGGYRNCEQKKPRTMSFCFVATLIFSVAVVVAVHLQMQRQRQRRKCATESLGPFAFLFFFL